MPLEEDVQHVKEIVSKFFTKIIEEGGTNPIVLGVIGLEISLIILYDIIDEQTIDQTVCNLCEISKQFLKENREK